MLINLSLLFTSLIDFMFWGVTSIWHFSLDLFDISF